MKPETHDPRRKCPECRLVRATVLSLETTDQTKRRQAVLERVLATFAANLDERLICDACAERDVAYRTPEQANLAVTCEHCGNVFQATRVTARFCSGRCRVAHHREQHAETA